VTAEVVNVSARSHSTFGGNHDWKSRGKEVGLANLTSADAKELVTVLNDPTSATTRLLTVWSNVPLLLMLDVDWERGPLVLIGLTDYMMWPLLPPGTLLQLDQKVRYISSSTTTGSTAAMLNASGKRCF
jgi:hypothetical protein